MIIYAETSAVLRWLFNEANGEAIRNSLRSAQKVVCSRLTLVESRRMIRRAAAEKRVTAVEAGDLMATLAKAAATWALLELTREVAQRAEGAFPDEPVRTLDAIHLASALVLRESLPRLVLLSADDRVRSNGRPLGFEVLP